MKSAILTLFYQNYNYGGILQGYALQQELKKIGVESEILNLDRKKMSRFSSKGHSKNKSTISRLKTKVNSFISSWCLKKRREAYRNFIDNYVKCSDVVYTDDNIKTANEKYDIFITGSDQVWSELSGRDATFLNFVEDDSRKCSYAASIGSDEVSDEYLEYMKAALESFSAISVREKKAASILASVGEKDISVVLDPVFFIDAARWKELADCVKKTFVNKCNSYGFMYFLGDGRSAKALVTSVCRERKLDSIMIPYGKMKINMDDMFICAKKVIDAGPLEFLRLINEAECVFTDSYHCVAFSIILNKPFVVFGREDKNRRVAMNSRIDNLLEIFSLEKRRVVNLDSMEKIEELLCEKIDWENVNSIICKKRVEGEQFLRNAVSVIRTEDE